MHRFFWIILTVNLFACQAISETHSDIQPQQVQSEAEKAKRVQAILAQYPLELSRVIRNGDDQEQIDFCNEFYSDFKAGKNIEYIEPVVRTDDMDHPELKKYSPEHCRNYDYGNDVSLEARYYGLQLVGDYGFQLYQLDLDHDLSNGKEELIYGEVIKPIQAGITNDFYSGYHSINLNECVYRYHLPVQHRKKLKKSISSDDSSGEFVETYNALVRYRENYYAFDLRDLRDNVNEESLHYLKLWKYTLSDNFKFTCSMSQLADQK